MENIKNFFQMFYLKKNFNLREEFKYDIDLLLLNSKVDFNKVLNTCALLPGQAKQAQ